jgi:hypothetical protein
MSRDSETAVSTEKPIAIKDNTLENADIDDVWNFSSIFGGKAVRVGPRIGPVLHSDTLDISSGDESTDAILAKQRELEDGNAIQYRTCSWQKVCISRNTISRVDS